uniref:G-protein coupled receptors family 1 profile domain-containing protein n=2 Tax=Sparus aurata TaxID=8175 RepID=A0A671TMV8_SPAAU
MPTEIILMQSCMFLDTISCAVFFLFSFILTSASVGSMVLISVDRYVAICYPLRYSSMITTRRVQICMSLSWYCAVTYSFMLLKDHLSQIDLLNSCFQECFPVINYIFGAVDLLVTFFCPLTVIIVLYMRVFVVAVSQARVMRSQISALKSNTITVKRSEMRAARTVGVILLVFVLCLLPFYSSFIAGHDITVQIWLFYCNSSFNPLIYAFFYPWFRKSVKVIVSLQILQPGSCAAKIM